MGRRTGAGGNSLGGCVDCRCVPPLSGVFQATHVKPDNRPLGLENDAIKAVNGAAIGCSGTVYLEVLQLCRSGWISWAAMVLAPLVAGLFKWRQFEPKVILLAVGWYRSCSPSEADRSNAHMRSRLSPGQREGS